MGDLSQDGRTDSVRLHKLMAIRGIGSRRRCEVLIAAGRVKVNGEVVTKMGITLSSSDQIEVDGKSLAGASPHAYVMLNKPPGYLSSAGDPQGRLTVLALVPSSQRLYPVGRLDLDSEGMLLLTDDGELTYKLTHPRFGVAREYDVFVRPAPNEIILAGLRNGVVISGRRTGPAEVGVIRRTKEGGRLRFVIHEGRKRQIRLMCLAVGLTIERLVRVRIGPLSLGSLKTGQYRSLTAVEIEALHRSVGVGERVAAADRID